MHFIRFAIENPVKVAVGVILLALFGTLGIFSVPIQLVPDVDAPVIKVTTRWTGSSPQEMESEIVDRQEEKLFGISATTYGCSAQTLARARNWGTTVGRSVDLTASGQRPL